MESESSESGESFDLEIEENENRVILLPYMPQNGETTEQHRARIEENRQNIIRNLQNHGFELRTPIESVNFRNRANRAFRNRPISESNHIGFRLIDEVLKKRYIAEAIFLDDEDSRMHTSIHITEHLIPDIIEIVTMAMGAIMINFNALVGVQDVVGRETTTISGSVEIPHGADEIDILDIVSSEIERLLPIDFEDYDTGSGEVLRGASFFLIHVDFFIAPLHDINGAYGCNCENWLELLQKGIILFTSPAVDKYCFARAYFQGIMKSFFGCVTDGDITLKEDLEEDEQYYENGMPKYYVPTGECDTANYRTIMKRTNNDPMNYFIHEIALNDNGYIGPQLIKWSALQVKNIFCKLLGTNLEIYRGVSVNKTYCLRHINRSKVYGDSRPLLYYHKVRQQVSIPHIVYYEGHAYLVPMNFNEKLFKETIKINYNYEQNLDSSVSIKPYAPLSEITRMCIVDNNIEQKPFVQDIRELPDKPCKYHIDVIFDSETFNRVWKDNNINENKVTMIMAQFSIEFITISDDDEITSDPIPIISDINTKDTGYTIYTELIDDHQVTYILRSKPLTSTLTHTQQLGYDGNTIVPLPLPEDPNIAIGNMVFEIITSSIASYKKSYLARDVTIKAHNGAHFDFPLLCEGNINSNNFTIPLVFKALKGAANDLPAYVMEFGYEEVTLNDDAPIEYQKVDMKLVPDEYKVESNGKWYLTHDAPEQYNNIPLWKVPEEYKTSTMRTKKLPIQCIDTFRSIDTKSLKKLCKSLDIPKKYRKQSSQSFQFLKIFGGNMYDFAQCYYSGRIKKIVSKPRKFRSRSSFTTKEEFDNQIVKLTEKDFETLKNEFIQYAVYDIVALSECNLAAMRSRLKVIGNDYHNVVSAASIASDFKKEATKNSTKYTDDFDSIFRWYAKGGRVYYATFGFDDGPFEDYIETNPSIVKLLENNKFSLLERLARAERLVYEEEIKSDPVLESLLSKSDFIGMITYKLHPTLRYFALAQQKRFTYGDVTSLYPTVMKTCRYPTTEVLEPSEREKCYLMFCNFLNNPTEENMSIVATKCDYCFMARVNIENAGDGFFSCLPSRGVYHPHTGKAFDKKSMNSSHDGEKEGVFPLVDLMQAIAYNHATLAQIPIIEVVIWHTAPIFEVLVTKMFELREQGKKDAKSEDSATRAMGKASDQFWKLCMNSMYGKTLQKVIDTLIDISPKHNAMPIGFVEYGENRITKYKMLEQPETIIHIAIFVLSYSKFYVNRILNNLGGKPGNIFHAIYPFLLGDTDSFTCRQRDVEASVKYLNENTCYKIPNKGLGCIHPDKKIDIEDDFNNLIEDIEILVEAANDSINFTDEMYEILNINKSKIENIHLQSVETIEKDVKKYIHYESKFDEYERTVFSQLLPVAAKTYQYTLLSYRVFNGVVEFRSHTSCTGKGIPAKHREVFEKDPSLFMKVTSVEGKVDPEFEENFSVMFKNNCLVQNDLIRSMPDTRAFLDMKNIEPECISSYDEFRKMMTPSYQRTGIPQQAIIIFPRGSKMHPKLYE